MEQKNTYISKLLQAQMRFMYKFYRIMKKDNLEKEVDKLIKLAKLRAKLEDDYGNVND